MRAAIVLATCSVLLTSACVQSTPPPVASAPIHPSQGSVARDATAAQMDANIALLKEDEAKLEALNERLAAAQGPAADNSDELFSCLKPGDCPTSYEQRAIQRAAKAWSCPAASIQATPRPTKGLAAPGSQMTFSAAGRAEYHAQAGVKGDAGFVLTGCDHHGIIACIPAHRTVATAQQTYDNTNDHLCLWATDPSAPIP